MCDSVEVSCLLDKKNSIYNLANTQQICIPDDQEKTFSHKAATSDMVYGTPNVMANS